MPIDRSAVDRIVGSLLHLPEDEAIRQLETTYGKSAEVEDARQLIRAYHRMPSILKTDAFASAAAAPADLVGSEIDQYHIVEQIGRGGMGVVYRAKQANLKRPVAIKVIASPSDRMTQRFLLEGEILAGLSSPYVATVHDSGRLPDKRPYLVMDLIDGPTITDYCREENVALDARLRLFCQVCEGVHSIHQKGVIHRDLKPGNILIQREPKPPIPRILDFGIAKTMDSTDHLTREGQPIGTLVYMSPERIDEPDHSEDVIDDVYSLGIVLYEILTDRLPWTRSEKSMRTQILEGNLTLPSKVVSKASTARSIKADLDNIVMTSTALERGRRYDSALALKADVERFLHGLPVEATPPSLGYRARKFCKRRPMTVVTLALLAALSAFAIWSFLLARDKRIGDYYAAISDIRTLLHEPRLGFRSQTLASFHDLAAADIDARDHYELRSLYLSVSSMYDLEKEHTLAVGIDAYTLAFSPDGRRLAIGQNVREGPCSVKLYDPVTGKEHKELTLPLSARGVRALQFARDSRGLFVGVRSGAVLSWRDVDVPEEFNQLTQMTGWVRDIKLTPTPNVLLISDGHHLKTIDDRSGEIIWRFTHSHRGMGGEVRAEPASGDVFWGGHVGLLRLEDVKPGEYTHRPFRRFKPAIERFTFVPSSRQLIVGSRGRLFSADSNMVEYQRFRDPHLEFAHSQTGEIRSLDLSPDELLVISGSSDRAAKLWHRGTGELLARIPVAGKGNVAVAFSPDGDRLAVTENRATVIYKIEGPGNSQGTTRNPFRFVAVQERPVASFAFSLSGRMATVSGGEQGVLTSLWEMRGAANFRRRASKPINGRVLLDESAAMAVSPDASLVAFFTDPDSVLSVSQLAVWSHESGSIVRPGTETRVKCLTFAMEALSATCGKRHGEKLVQWRPGESETTTFFTNTDDAGLPGIGAIVVRESYTAIGGDNGLIKTLDLDGQVSHILSTSRSNPITAMSASADGAELVVGTDSGKVFTVQVDESLRLTEGVQLPPHFARVNSAAISPAASLIATAGRDRTVRLLRRKGNEWEPLFQRTFQAPVARIQFTPDGNNLGVLVLRERQVRLWDIAAIREELGSVGLGW